MSPALGRPTDTEIFPNDTEAPSLADIRAFLRPGAHLLVTSHSRPDGDAVGSTLAFAAILDQLGLTADLVLADPVPQVYGTLPDVGRIRIQRTIDPALYDGAIVLECDALTRTGLQGLQTLPVFNLDHHSTGSSYGALNWIDCSANAVAVLVFRLALMLGLQVTPPMATCMYTALFTDTGAFTYPGTASASFALAAELIALGADADAVAHDVLYSVSAAHIRLLGIALSRMQVQGTVAWSYVSQEDIARVGATDEDSEGTVTYLISIAGIDVAAFLRELPGDGAAVGTAGRYRVSFRSKFSLDVSRVALECGGGGHRTAAGCVVDGALQTTIDRVLRAIENERARTLPR